MINLLAFCHYLKYNDNKDTAINMEGSDGKRNYHGRRSRRVVAAQQDAREAESSLGRSAREKNSGRTRLDFQQEGDRKNFALMCYYLKISNNKIKK